MTRAMKLKTMFSSLREGIIGWVSEITFRADCQRQASVTGWPIKCYQTVSIPCTLVDSGRIYHYLRYLKNRAQGMINNITLQQNNISALFTFPSLTFDILISHISKISPARRFEILLTLTLARLAVLRWRICFDIFGIWQKAPMTLYGLNTGCPICLAC